MTPSMTPAEHLRAARALLTPEGAWTQGTFARCENGNSIYLKDENAVCWCAMGAIWFYGYSSKAEMFLRNIVENITTWSDSPNMTQAEVLAAFDKAIELAEAQS